jgi:hypothetical protein
VQIRADNRLEIIFDGDLPVEDWLAIVRERVGEIVGSAAGARLKREVS